MKKTQYPEENAFLKQLLKAYHNNLKNIEPIVFINNVSVTFSIEELDTYEYEIPCFNYYNPLGRVDKTVPIIEVLFRENIRTAKKDIESILTYIYNYIQEDLDLYKRIEKHKLIRNVRGERLWKN